MEIIIVKWKGRKKAGDSQPRDKIKKNTAQDIIGCSLLLGTLL